jgi:hypothetical protein
MNLRVTLLPPFHEIFKKEKITSCIFSLADMRDLREPVRLTEAWQHYRPQTTAL